MSAPFGRNEIRLRAIPRSWKCSTKRSVTVLTVHGLLQREILEALHQPEQGTAAEETDLARDVHLQVGDVVDVRHATEPAHEQRDERRA